MPLLLKVTGNGWDVEIVGRLPTLPAFLAPLPSSVIQVSGRAKTEAFDPKTSTVRPVLSGEAIEPLFFEAVFYDIYFTRTCDAITAEFSPFATKRHARDRMDHYAIDFGNNVGFSEFTIRDEAEVVSVRFEVFARKVDYRNDYMAMRQEVSGIARNLAMTANAKTFGLAAPIKNHQPTLVEWFALLKTYFEDFHKIAHFIAKHPHARLVKEEQLKSTERAKRVDARSLNAALRSSSATSGPRLLATGLPLPRHLPQRSFALTHDTPENRYYKAVLLFTYRNIRALRRVTATGDEDSELDSEQRFFDSICPQLKEMEKRLERLLATAFLKSVGTANLMRPRSMVYSKHLAYSRFDRLARLLNGALSFATNNVVPIGVKDTALLYEYWCFLKLVEILQKRLDLIQQSVVTTKRMRLTVTLAKGRSAAITFVHAPTGRSLHVVYNRLFDRLPTVAQKPDNIIQMASDEKFYVFDAKYRLQFDEDYIRLYAGPGPTTDDINTMHRYRDAIAIPHPIAPDEYKAGVVIGAAVLFPFPDEGAYSRHKFYRSLQSFEIGGLPFLPRATSLVEKKISDILDLEFGQAPREGP